MAASSISLSLPPLTSTPSTQRLRYSLNFCNPSFHLSPSSLSSTYRTNFIVYPLQENSQKSFWRISAISEDVLPPDTPIENTQQIVSTYSTGGVSNVIQTLLFIAFVGLSILTVGVVYIAVTDFLQKRESDKFEKEEASKKGKKRRKRVVRAGPKGFGQKVVEDDDF